MSLLFCQVFFQESQYGFKQDLSSVVIRVHKRGTDEVMGSCNGDNHCSVVRVDEAEQRTTGNKLVVIKQLAVIPGFYSAQVFVGADQK